MSFLTKYWYQIKYRDHLLRKFWKQTPFAYVKTYSGFKSEEIQIAQQKVETLQKELVMATPIEKVKIKDQILQLERKVMKFEGEIRKHNTIIDLRGNRHYTTVETATIQYDDQRIKVLQDIFYAPIKELVFAPCRPIYRDAIAFYSEKDEIVNILHICFQCLDITDKKHNFYCVDYHTYTQLGFFLRELEDAI